jgi:hypothetical protein
MNIFSVVLLFSQFSFLFHQFSFPTPLFHFHLVVDPSSAILVFSFFYVFFYKIFLFDLFLPSPLHPCYFSSTLFFIFIFLSSRATLSDMLFFSSLPFFSLFLNFFLTHFSLNFLVLFSHLLYFLFYFIQLF